MEIEKKLGAMSEQDTRKTIEEDLLNYVLGVAKLCHGIGLQHELWQFNPEPLHMCIRQCLDRQADISWNNAWKVQKDLLSNMQDEIEYLRKVCKTQADSFAAIENENAALRSKLNRIRELAERLDDRTRNA